MIGGMEILPISEVKARIAELVDKAAREHDSYTITRNGRPDAVILSMAEYESMRETLDLLSRGPVSQSAHGVSGTQRSGSSGVHARCEAQS
jgi:prevent-host-death family protein